MMKLLLTAASLSAAGFAMAPLVAAPQSASGSVTRDFMVSSIATLTLEGDIAATLTHDPRASLIASGHPMDIDRLNITRNGRSMRISMSQSGQSYQRKGPVNLALRSADVETITLNGGATLNVDRLDQQRVTLNVFGSGALAIGEITADRLRVTLMGSGTLTLGKGQVGKADFIVDGGGRLDAAGVSTQDLNVTSSGPTFIAAAANSSAEVKAYGAGSISIGGRASCRIPYAAQAKVECSGGVRRD